MLGYASTRNNMLSCNTARTQRCVNPSDRTGRVGCRYRDSLICAAMSERWWLHVWSAQAETPGA
jgi:hypothetical protein